MATFIGQLIFDGAEAFKTTVEEVAELKKTGVIHHTLSYFEPTSFFYRDCCQGLEPIGVSKFPPMLRMAACIKMLTVWIWGTTVFSLIMVIVEVGDNSTNISDNWAIIIIVTVLTALMSDLVGRLAVFGFENLHQRDQDTFQFLRSGPIIMDQSVEEFNEYYVEKFDKCRQDYNTRKNQKSCFLRTLSCICPCLTAKQKFVFTESNRRAYAHMQSMLLEGNILDVVKMNNKTYSGQRCKGIGVCMIGIGLNIWFGFTELNNFAVWTGTPKLSGTDFAWVIIQSMLLGWAQAFPTIVLLYYLKRNCIKPKGNSLLNSDNDPLATGSQNNYGSM